MNLVTQSELKQIVKFSMSGSVMTTFHGGGRVLTGDFDGKPFKLVTQRGDIRIFKTLDAVTSMLKSIGITTYTVVG